MAMATTIDMVLSDKKITDVSKSELSLLVKVKEHSEKHRPGLKWGLAEWKWESKDSQREKDRMEVGCARLNGWGQKVHMETSLCMQ